MHECVVSYVLCTHIVCYAWCIQYCSSTYVQQELDDTEAVVGLGDSLPLQISVALMAASTRDATI